MPKILLYKAPKYAKLYGLLVYDSGNIKGTRKFEHDMEKLGEICYN